MAKRISVQTLPIGVFSALMIGLFTVPSLAWSLEPSGPDSREIRYRNPDGESAGRVNHVFTPRSWAPRGLGEPPDRTRARAARSKAEAEAQLDEVGSLRYWMQPESRVEKISAEAIVDSQLPEETRKKPSPAVSRSGSMGRPASAFSNPRNGSRPAKAKRSKRDIPEPSGQSSRPIMRGSPTRW